MAKNSNPLLTVAFYKKEIKTACLRFGTYTYEDKGPGEVMDLDEISANLNDLQPKDVVTLLVSLSKSDYRCQLLAEEIAHHLSDWDELWEDKGMEDFGG